MWFNSKTKFLGDLFVSTYLKLAGTSTDFEPVLRLTYHLASYIQVTWSGPSVATRAVRVNGQVAES